MVEYVLASESTDGVVGSVWCGRCRHRDHDETIAQKHN